MKLFLLLKKLIFIVTRKIKPVILDKQLKTAMMKMMMEMMMILMMMMKRRRRRERLGVMIMMKDIVVVVMMVLKIVSCDGFSKERGE